MYYTHKFVISANTPSIDFIGVEGLINFFCYDNTKPLLLKATVIGGTYRLTRFDGSMFRANSRVIVYGLPKTIVAPKNPEAFLELLVAYSIWLYVFNREQTINTARIVSPRLINNISYNLNSYYLGKILTEFVKGDVPKIANNKTLLIPGKFKASDNIFIANMEEQENNFVCNNSLIVKNFFIYDNFIAIPNISLSFVPTHYLRCAGQFISIGTNAIPIEVDSTKPIEYKTAANITVPTLPINVGLYASYTLRQSSTILAKDAMTTAENIKLVKLNTAQTPIRVEYGVGTTLKGFFDIIPSDFTAKKINFTLNPDDSGEAIYILLKTNKTINFKPQQLFTAGIEMSNDSWTKTTTDANETLFTLKHNIHAEDTILITIGWRL